MKRRKEFQDLLAEKKLKKTSQRAVIWQHLVDSKGHPSVEELHDALVTQGHRIGVATIYRTVKLLLDAGMVRQSKTAGITRYEPVVNEPNHLHFVCNACSETVEFRSRKIESLIAKVTAEESFEERFSRYTIFGLCKSCARKEKQSSVLSEETRMEKTAARDALELTLTLERLGFAFYTNAAKKTRNDRGRVMFQRLAEEESSHLRRLREAYRVLLDEHGWLKRAPAQLPVSRKIARDLFPGKTLRLEVNEGTSDVEALSMAMEFERRSHRFFKDFAGQITDPTGRKAFLEFAEEEQEHLDSLVSEYENITNERRSH